MIQGLALTFLAIIAGLVSVLIGLVGWIILKFMKNELHLDIKINSGNKSPFADSTPLDNKPKDQPLFPL